jgi:GMP synthase-like glutamine amidotransferase
MTRKVYIVGGNNQYRRMFKDAGWEIEESEPVHAMLVQFTGGEDVTPELYGHKPHKSTGNNPNRDRYEQALFMYLKQCGIAMAGICRGSQFLNVMCGGTLWQDVDKHATAKGHRAWDVKTGKEFHVTSTHHQMMSPSKDAQIVAVANEATSLDKMMPLTAKHDAIINYPKNPNAFFPYKNSSNVYQQRHALDTEAVWYEEQRVFCFQPHPEFNNQSELAKIYLGYVDQYLFNQRK